MRSHAHMEAPALCLTHSVKSPVRNLPRAPDVDCQLPAPHLHHASHTEPFIHAPFQHLLLQAHPPISGKGHSLSLAPTSVSFLLTPDNLIPQIGGPFDIPRTHPRPPPALRAPSHPLWTTALPASPRVPTAGYSVHPLKTSQFVSLPPLLKTLK